MNMEVIQRRILKTEYKREMSKTYLIIQQRKNDYQTEMICQNTIEGFAHVKKVKWDNEDYLYYDVTSKQPLDTAFAKRRIGMAEIKTILYAIDNLTQTVNRYLLDVDKVLLNPEYVFWDYNDNSINWIYYPSNSTNGYLELAEFILEKIDNENTEVVKVAYEFYKRVKESNYSMENLYELIKNPEGSELYKEDYEESRVETIPETVYKESKTEGIKNKLIKGLKYKKNKKENDWFKKEIESANDIKELSPRIEEEIGTMLLNREVSEIRRLVSKNGTMKDVMLTDFPYLIGSRADSVDICIKDKMVSKIHAQIAIFDNRIIIEDLNSLNGTYKNGEKIDKQTELNTGDEITFGSSKFTFF